MTRFRLREGVVLDIVGKEVVATLPTGDFVVFNEAAAPILLLLHDEGTISAEDACSSLVQTYGSGRSRRNANRLLRKMVFAGVIEPEEGGELAEAKGDTRRITRRSFLSGATASGAVAAMAPAAFASEPPQDAGTRQWLDPLGGKVEVPARVERVAPYGPFAQALLEAIAPDMLCQVTPRGMHASASDATRKKAQEPELASAGTAGLSSSAMGKYRPDVIVDIALNKSFFGRGLEEQTDVPVARSLADTSTLPSVCRAVGGLTGRQDRAEAVADYLEALLAGLRQCRERISDDRLKRVYFGEGCCGFSTKGAGTLLDTVIDMAGGMNVARELDLSERREIGCSQILDLQIDTAILALAVDFDEPNQRGIVERLWHDIARYAGLETAFVPVEPCPWLGNSPLHMMTLGVMWLGQKLHPEVFSYDLEAEVGNFFELLYGIELSHEEEKDVLESGLDYLPGEDESVDAAVPDMELITASSLNSAPANLRSGYQPPDPGPTTTYSYCTYICIASNSVYGLGHAAAITRQMIKVGSTVTSDLMDLFSFYTDPLNYLSALMLNISDMYNILTTQEPGIVGHLRSDKTMEEGTVSTAYAWDSFMSNSEVSYSGSLGSFGSGSDVYDRIIGVQVSQTKYTAIRNEAVLCVTGPASATIGTDYRFVGNNCGDFALNLLDECGGITVNYNRASTIAWLRLSKDEIAEAILLDGQLSVLQSALESVIGEAIDDIEFSGVIPTIPNRIYDCFLNIAGAYTSSIDMRFRQNATSGWIV